MYKIDFEIKLKFDYSHIYIPGELEAFFNSNQYLIQKGVEFGFNRCREVTKIGICKTNSEEFAFIRGRFFYSKQGETWDAVKSIDFCIRRELRNSWGSDIIIETRFANVVEFNNLYYYLFVRLKEKIQSVFSGLKQRLLG